MTLFEFQARNIEQIAETLAYFVETTREDRLRWQPTLEGAAPTRSVLEQISECVIVNRAFAALLRGQSPPQAPMRQAAIEFDGAASAQEQLLASARDLAAAVRGLDDAALEREYPSWRGPIPGATAIVLPYRNMAYHGGQINLIQLLYGDAEFHVPPRPAP
jgi:hypothetical protein